MISSWPRSSRFPHAVVHASASVADSVEIGPYCVVGPEVSIGAGSVLTNNVTVVGQTRIGRDNKLYAGSTVGTHPQDLKYQGEATKVVLGDRNTIRECVTIHKGTAGGSGVTSLADDNLIMACCHVAHDCVLGSRIIMGNSVLLGGHVRVDDQAHFGGLAAVHHFTTVGTLAFVGGMTRITKDVPPYMLVEGNPSRVWGVNRVGCERRGLAREVIDALHQAFKRLYRESSPQAEVIAELRASDSLFPEVEILLDFLDGCMRGPKGRAREKNR